MPAGPYDEREIDPVFRALCSTWINKIDISRRHRQRVWGNAAGECYSFYCGPRSWANVMSGDIGGVGSPDLPSDPTFKVSVNKTFEFVTIFGPSLYYRNAVRTVKPRQPVVVPPQFFGNNPLGYQQLLMNENQRVQLEGLTSVLLESYLNWTPNEYELDIESRQQVDEALIKGRGILWTELYTPPGSSFNVIRSVWDTVDHLYCDPDAGRFTKCEWIARKMVEPVWKVESDRGLRKGSLKGNLESQHKTEEVDRSEDGDYSRKTGKTNDLLVYYKIYSKMGAGGRLQGLNPDYREPLEKLGDYVFLEVAENCPFPLNLPPDVKDLPEYTSDPAAWDQMILEMLAWPTPFWAADEWPCTEQDFHSTFNCPWPRPHLQAGMGELKFLNWCMSFLMGKVRNTSRDFIAIKKEAGEEIKTSLLTGGDLTLLEIEAAHGNISELVSFLQHPEVNGDVWKMIEAVERNFERRVGLNDLMYGQQGDDPAMRSSYEAQARQQSTQIRPDDMRKQVEACQARVAFKEAMAARYHLRGNDVRHVFGEMGAQAWDQFVASRDLDTIAHQLEFRVESGSTERPNRQALTNEMNNAMQTVAPIFQGYAQLTGDFSPLNNLVIDWAKAHDLDAEKYSMKSVSPPQPTSPDAAVTEPQKDTQNAQVPSG